MARAEAAGAVDDVQTVCEYCGLPIEEEQQDCAAHDGWVCHE